MTTHFADPLLLHGPVVLSTRAGKLPHSRVFVTSLGHVVYGQPLRAPNVCQRRIISVTLSEKVPPD